MRCKHRPIAKLTLTSTLHDIDLISSTILSDVFMAWNISYFHKTDICIHFCEEHFYLKKEFEYLDIDSNRFWWANQMEEREKGAEPICQVSVDRL